MAPWGVTIAVHRELLIKALFVISLACHLALPPAPVKAAKDHDHCHYEVDDSGRVRYGTELPPCMIPKRAPKPAHSDNASLPWDKNYINLYTPTPDGGLVVSDDGKHVNLRITCTNQTYDMICAGDGQCASCVTKL